MNQTEYAVNELLKSYIELAKPIHIEWTYFICDSLCI